MATAPSQHRHSAQSVTVTHMHSRRQPPSATLVEAQVQVRVRQELGDWQFRQCRRKAWRAAEARMGGMRDSKMMRGEMHTS
ncbi:uncharacterized protein SPSK_02100 [Sporothrix schenckii 1099-18]|uniref:Uncharacterized protein n=1 Tax=Sporothrix schenckii 1099-18 TaxID=1397361 RepID=A0A0F2MEM9_SPOSC|nr:uncharacterized protein SPSK_02100 [Sporothrix schenckii 1099-18]KJR87529.1 hypothetical protein SPSK_02100 [Sporothrix schenckii 1099-18]